MSVFSAANRSLRSLAARTLSRCVICHRSPDDPGIDICHDCLGHFPRLRHQGWHGDGIALCLRCGASLPTRTASSHTAAMAGCDTCDGHPPLFSTIVAVCRYDWPIDRLLRDLKYREHRHLAAVFGTLLAGEARHAVARWPDLLLPVPLHDHRYRERGFNQAADIARRCGRLTRIPIAEQAVSRIVDTGVMAERSRAARQSIIRGAFRADPALAGRHVAIVDDVLTSGATTGELARELYDSGVSSVALWVVARTAADAGSLA